MKIKVDFVCTCKKNLYKNVLSTNSKRTYLHRNTNAVDCIFIKSTFLFKIEFSSKLNSSKLRNNFEIVLENFPCESACSCFRLYISIKLRLTYMGGMQNEIEPKMDEAADDSATQLCYAEETAIKERRLLLETVFYTTNTGNTGNCK